MQYREARNGVPNIVPCSPHDNPGENNHELCSPGTAGGYRAWRFRDYAVLLEAGIPLVELHACTPQRPRDRNGALHEELRSGVLSLHEEETVFG